MRKFLYGILFLVSFLFFAYLTFPLEAMVESQLLNRGILYESISASKFPLKVKIEKVSFKGLVIDEISLSPDIFSIFGKIKNLNAELNLCGGKLNMKFTYPLKEVLFKAYSLDVSRCLQEFPFKVKGAVSGHGNFEVNGRKIEKGNAKFDVNSLEVDNLTFGILDLKSANFGNGEISVSVKKRNLLNIEINLSGRDVDVISTGILRFNSRDFSNSYVNLNFKLKVKKQPFNGKTFNFKLKGRLMELL
jgi:type II secretion system protein N